MKILDDKSANELRSALVDMGHECIPGYGADYKDCLGVIIPQERLTRRVMTIAYSLGNQYKGTKFEGDFDLAISLVKFDSIGYDAVMFFPGVPYINHEEC